MSGWTIILILTIFSGKNLKSEKDKKRRSSKRIYCTGKVSPKVYCRRISILLVFVIVSSFWGAEKIIQIKPIKRPDFITQLRNDWKEGNFIPTEFFYLGFSQGKGGISAGRLGQYDTIHFENENHLKLTVGNTGNGAIYLRGYVGSRYTGNSWQKLPRKSYKEVNKLFEFGSSIQEISTERVNSMMAILSGLYDGKIVSQPFSETSVMEIENVGASRRWTYTPYFYYPTEDLISDDDTLPTANLFQTKTRLVYQSLESWDSLLGVDSNIDSWVENIDGVPWKSFYSRKEREYREFVYDNYMDVPKSCEKAVERFVDKFEALEMQPYLLSSYFSGYFTYTLSPGRLPKGEDFITRFLDETQSGYCTHFASAAVMIFRYLGIPARYVEGYLVKKGQDRTSDTKETVAYKALRRQSEKEVYSPAIEIDVKDNNAHAWPEVYISQLGWVPVEVTPGYDGGNRTSADSKPDDYSPPPENSSKAEESSSESEESTSEEMSSQTESSLEQDNSTSLESINSEGHVDLGGGGIFKKLIPGAFILGLCLLLLWGLLLLRMIRLRIKNKKTHSPDCRKNLVEIYRQTEALFRFFGLTRNPSQSYLEFEKDILKNFQFVKEYELAPLLNSMTKLTYSSHDISDEEVNEARDILDMVIQRFYDRCGKWKRFAMKYIYHFC